MHKFYFPLGLALLCAFPVHSAQAQSSPARSELAQNSSAVVPDQAPADLTLQTALELAFARNKDLSAARAEADAVAATVEQAGARPNPEVSILMEDTRRSTRTTTWQLNQPIELGGKRGARIKAARRAHDIAMAELSAKKAQVRADVTTAWFDTLIARDKLQLAQDLLQLSQRASEMTGKRVAAGKLSPVEHTRARVADAGARLAVAQADSDLLLARQRLASYWGEAGGAWTLPTGDVQTLPVLSPLADVLQRVDDSPAMRLAQSEVERRRALADVEKARRIPDPTLSLGQKRDAEAGRTMWVVGVAMPLPLFDSNHGNRLEALKRVDKARDEQAAAQLRVRHDAARYYERRRQSAMEADTLRRDILPAARSAHEAAARGFELGKFSFTEVLDTQRTLLQAQSQYWQALASAHQAAAELERLTGAALADDRNVARLTDNE